MKEIWNPCCSHFAIDSLRRVEQNPLPVSAVRLYKRMKCSVGTAQFKQLNRLFEKKIAHAEIGCDLSFGKAYGYMCFG